VTYTVTAVAGVLVALLVDLRVLRTSLVRRKAFWVSYAIVLGFQLVVNGLLTGLRIVRYDGERVVGLRIAWAPVEDLLFGFAMVTATLSLWVFLERRARTNPASPTRARRGSPTHTRAEKTS
jgi:lycopene cyclase domain-containing protein